MASPKVVVCLPSHGGAFREHEKCLRALMSKHPEWSYIELPGMPCIDVGRSSLTESALRHLGDEPAVILWLDNDMVFTVATCEAIVAEAFERQAVVGCLYAGKKFGSKPQVAWLPGTREFTAFAGGEILEVEAIGFGCVAVWSPMYEAISSQQKLPALRVLDLTLRPWYTARSDGGWETMHSDDYAFCRRARECGFSIFADTRQRVGHIGSHIYHLEDSLPSLVRAESVKFTFGEEVEQEKDAK